MHNINKFMKCKQTEPRRNVTKKTVSGRNVAKKLNLEEMLPKN